MSTALAERAAPVPASPRATPRGLTTAQARERVAAVGANVLAKREQPHWAARFARNLSHLFAVLLWVGAALAWVGGMPELSVAITAVIFVNAA